MKFMSHWATDLPATFAASTLFPLTVAALYWPTARRDTLLPLAIERVELALGAYRGGTGSLIDVVAARRERVEIELKTIALEGAPVTSTVMV